MINRTDTGPLIRELRDRLGLTQERLAAKLGVSCQAIARWENDQACASPSRWTTRQIQQLLRELGSRGEDLLAKYVSSEH